MKKQYIQRGLGLLGCLIIGSGIISYYHMPDIDHIGSIDQSHTLEQLIIQTEDRRFYHHQGIDRYGTLRAAYYNIRYNTIIQGGSTIQQQLLKHYWGNHERSLEHKIQEMRGSLILTLQYSRTSILSYYINHVPFPNQSIIGYPQACRYYFDKECSQLFDSELLFLIALAQYGANPYRESHFIATKKLSIQLCHKSNQDCSMINSLNPMSYLDLSRHDDSLDPRTRIALEQYPSNVFNHELTNSIDNLIESNRGLLQQHNAHDCCIVVLGSGGSIMSYNQCRRYEDRVGTVDLCRTRRQTGSAIKPFIYAKAFKQFGYSGGTTIDDEAVSFTLQHGGVYEPKNFDNRFHGKVTLAQALGNSFNIPAIKLTQQLGVGTVINFINQLRKTYGYNSTGLQEDMSLFTASQLGLSVGLGTYELSPLEFAKLWGYRYHEDPIITQQIKSILSYSLNRIISFGQDNILNRDKRFVKTGTSRKFIDGRTCGGRLDRELIVCVRVGNHDVSSMDSSSSDTAGYLWNLTTQILDHTISS